MSAAVATPAVKAAAMEAATIATTAAVPTPGITAAIASTTVAVAPTTIAISTAAIAVATTIIASVAKADPYPTVSVRIAIGIVTIGVIRVRCGSISDWRRIGLRLFGLDSSRVVSGLGAGVAIIGNLAVVAVVLVVWLGCVVIGVRPLNGG